LLAESSFELGAQSVCSLRQCGIPDTTPRYSHHLFDLAGNYFRRSPVLYGRRAATMFRLLCTGAIVAAMMGIHVQAQEDGDKATALRGKKVFEQCSGCHSAETDEKRVGPSLKGLFQRPKLHNGKPVTEKSIRSRIEQGGDGMPAFSDLLSDKEKIDLIAYLKAL
jgi:cytochrome c